MEKRTLITGGTSGIGLEMARIMASKGHDLILVARRKEKLEHLKKELENGYGISVDVIVKDLTEANAAKEIFEFTEKKHFHVDVLINNAGFGDYGKFYYRSLEKQTRMVQLNIIALMGLTHLYLPDMLTNSKGRIMNVASMAAFQPGPLMSVYYASKAFVLSFSEALSVELKGTGVKVTALCPGPTSTEFGKVAEFRRLGLLKRIKNQSAQEVAEYAIRALFANKLIAVPKIGNKLLVQCSKWLPRCITRNLVFYLQK